MYINPTKTIYMYPMLIKSIRDRPPKYRAIIASLRNSATSLV